LTPIRRLDGITYWVIEDPSDIEDFVRTVLRKEWEEDLRSEGKDPTSDPWLANLMRRHWRLAVLDLGDITPGSDYVMSERLRQRRAELKRSLETYGSVIWPLVVRVEGNVLADGYCRYSTLREMGVRRAYAYVGSP
jgi:hypothetical protein